MRLVASECVSLDGVIEDPAGSEHFEHGGWTDPVKALKQQPGNDLLIYSSAMLVQELARHHLIDEYRLALYPVVISTGKRLFDRCYVKLELAAQQPTSSGVLFLTYRPAGSRP
jgi:dihydrofolate reductase